MTQKFVIKIGGSLLFNDQKQLNIEWIAEICKLIKQIKNFEKIVIVTGGGIIARDYIKAVRTIYKNESFCDLLGIEVSRINARVFIALLGDIVYPSVPKNVEELAIALINKSCAVVGGIQPGQSTTSVALEIAEFINASEIFILTDVDGIYDKDPKKYPDAKLFERISYDKLESLILEKSGSEQAAAGEYRIFDAVSLQILKRSKIPVRIINGSNLSVFKDIILNRRKTYGTLIL
ncbi:MAG: UMP kinase [Promethearchaeia archaeon]